MSDFILYGANGYTGQLIITEAKKYGLTPLLSGRSAEKLKPLAESHNLKYKAVDLKDRKSLEELISGFPLVLHAAGPFVHTAEPMIKACMAKGTHYVDITGEIPVFELAASLDKQALEAGVMLLPGGGFDVVPTDCIAKYLSSLLKDADHLKLAFAMSGGGVSHGTATTMAENMGKGGAVRKDGKITKVPLGHKTMTVDFVGKKLFTMTIPWGDVSTAYYSTGIPNIETYMATHPKNHRWLKFQGLYNWFLKLPVFTNYMKRKIDAKPAGPNAERRAKAKSLVWGEVSNKAGKKVTARLIGPEGYNLTATSAVLIAKKIMDGKAKAGFQTPSNAFGADFVLEIPGVRRELC